ncbi:MAG TPA: hypothetical protein VNT76_11320 [Candidatus Binatus sp.]|nr:hypothetical protein [Candidatus Binatus sp.]
MTAASAQEQTACAIVTASEAESFIGGPLTVSKIDKKIMINAPWSHDSLCTYVAQGEDVDSPAGAARFLDLSLRFFDSAEIAQKIHESMIQQFRKLAAEPDAPYKFITMAPLEGFDGKAFLLEVIADPISDYKSAQVLFYKDKVGGSIAAWKKPESSLETTKSVLKHILSKLP